MTAPICQYIPTNSVQRFAGNHSLPGLQLVIRVLGQWSLHLEGLLPGPQVGIDPVGFLGRWDCLQCCIRWVGWHWYKYRHQGPLLEPQTEGLLPDVQRWLLLGPWEGCCLVTGWVPGWAGLAQGSGWESLEPNIAPFHHLWGVYMVVSPVGPWTLRTAGRLVDYGYKEAAPMYRALSASSGVQTGLSPTGSVCQQGSADYGWD